MMKAYYDKNNIKIYCGDNVKVMRETILTDSIDLTVTSPPYDNLRDYNGYTWDFEAVAAELWRVTKPGGVVVWVVGDATIDGSETGTSDNQKRYFVSLGFLVETMIYHKKNPVPNQTGIRYQNSFEFMFVFSKGTPKTFNPIKVRMTEGTIGRQRYTMRYSGFRQKNGESSLRNSWGKNKETILSNVWSYTVGTGNTTKDSFSFQHPAIFPEALARDHIISWSNPGDLICDPFLGSGTTAKMAQELGRRFVGAELSEEYCKIAVERLRQPSFFSIPDEPEQPTQAGF